MKNRQIVFNDSEEWAELLCRKEQTESAMIEKNGLNCYVKKNRLIVCNNSEEWAEFLCQESRLSAKDEHADCLE